MSSPRVAVVSGSGRYVDPWHPFADTSAAVARILAEAGLEVAVDDDVDRRLADLTQTDLLVLNIGRQQEPSEADAAVRAGLLAYVEAGKPILALHVAATSLGSVPEWESILGGIWVRGTTFHPKYGPSHIEITDAEHPITAGLRDFDIVDERYTSMRVDPGLRVLARHTYEGAAHPLLWAHRAGAANVVYDALGHDLASYDSAEHQELLRRSALWLTSPRA